MAGTRCGRMVYIHFVTASFLMETGDGEPVIPEKTTLLSVKNMPKHVSVRAAKFRTEALYENRCKAYYDLCKLWYYTLEQMLVC